MPRYLKEWISPFVSAASVGNPGHLLSTKIVHAIIGSACLCFKLAPAFVSVDDMSRFFIVAWATHPDIIPNKVGCAILEPEEEELAGLPPSSSMRRRSSIRSKTHSTFVTSSKFEGDKGYSGHDAGPRLL
jgi:hypothetical protein